MNFNLGYSSTFSTMVVSPETFALFENIEVLCEHLTQYEISYEARLRGLVDDEASIELLSQETLDDLQLQLNMPEQANIPFIGAPLNELKRCKTHAYSIQKEWIQLKEESRPIVLPRIARRFLSRCTHLFYRFTRVMKSVDDPNEVPRFLQIILDLVRECKDIIQSPEEAHNPSDEENTNSSRNNSQPLVATVNNVPPVARQVQMQHLNAFRCSTPTVSSETHSLDREKLEKTIKEITDKCAENLKIMVAEVVNQSLGKHVAIQARQHPNSRSLDQQAHQLNKLVYNHPVDDFVTDNPISHPMLAVRNPHAMTERTERRYHNEDYQNLNSHGNPSVSQSGIRNPFTTRNIVQTINGWKINFDGTDKLMSYEHYVGSLKHFKSTLNLSDEDLMCHILLTLSGSVRSWYLSMSQEEIERMNLDTFLGELRKRFTVTRTKMEISIELMQCQYNPKTPISNFIDDLNLRLSCQPFDWTLQEKIVVISHTLPIRVQQFIVTRDFGSMEEFRSFCDKIHSKIESVLKTKKISKVDVDETGLSNEVNEESYEVDAIGNQQSNGFNKNSQYRPNNNNNSNNNRNQNKRPNDSKSQVSQSKSQSSSSSQETDKYGYDQNGRRYFKQKPSSGCFICGDESHRRYACMVIPPFNCCYSCGERNVTLYTCKNPFCVEKCKAKQSKN